MGNAVGDETERKILVTGGSGFIGTNFVDLLVGGGVHVVNVDVSTPLKEAHVSYWRRCDILDLAKLKRIFRDAAPTEVVHLAARTDTDATTLEDYRVNTDGTANVLEAIKATAGISRVIVASTQFVCAPGSLPKHDADYNPHTVYGRSKAISEQLVRQANLSCTWTIVRPTNVWGPWHPRYPREFWRVLKKGLYFHPGPQPVVRSYGYVGNLIFQIEAILKASPEVVETKVYYLGDKPINLLDWVNEFASALTGREARIAPRSFVRSLAVLGDALSSIGITFPIDTSRFRSMTQDYPTPMEPTITAFGEPPYSLKEGVDETVGWLKSENAFWV